MKPSLLFSFLCVSGVACAQTTSGTINGQTVQMTLCEKVTPAGQDVTPTNATKTFAFKGTVPNVFVVLRFNPPAPVKELGYKVAVTKDGSFADDREVEWMPGGKTAYVSFTFQPGDYEITVVNKAKETDVFAKDHFTVGKDTVGDRALDNIKSGIGKMTFCQKAGNSGCTAETATLPADQPFGAMVTLPVQAGTTLTMWVIYKQKPDGTDGEWVNEYTQRLGETSWKHWWTNTFNLPKGKYTIYSIAASTAQVSERTGNLKQYYAKAAVTIK